jgi:hypothetical protein
MQKKEKGNTHGKTSDNEQHNRENSNRGEQHKTEQNMIYTKRAENTIRTMKTRKDLERTRRRK